MASNSAACAVRGEGNAALFDAVEAFLRQNGLSPDPLHYSFAYDLLTNPAGALAKATAALTDGGVRLSSHDIERLGGSIGALATPAPVAPSPSATDSLVAETQMQAERFADMIAAIRADTEDFGRDLAASAHAIRQAPAVLGVDEVVRLTSVMLDRVQSAEQRLAHANSEASDLREKLEEARGDARRDPLTDLPNRRAFEEAFTAQTGAGADVRIAVCDIDHFKQVNDKFGHAVGDRVLKAIADALRQACAGQLVARYGGEEFVVLFAGVDQDAALATLETARESVAAKRYRLRETDEPLGAITFSAGLTAYQPGEMVGAAFGRADKLLYAAKDAGRNTVRW
ncbi:MAG: GGDEF domain-containing protein [Pseudomonadota bacterium]|nr:GGDEF domain-containing protein [Pseudomonadota bacterium]